MANGEGKKVIVGLGNPGKEYEHTYHNVGWLALDQILEDELGAEKNGAIEWKRHKNLFEYFEASSTIFIRPLTYMNESGAAVREALKKFRAFSSLTVLHDDSDIVIGEYKISFARNSAGHKGVQSIIDALKTNAFTRVRIGIRPVSEKRRQKAGEFALKKITAVHQKILASVFSSIIKSHGKRKSVPGLLDLGKRKAD